MHVRLSWKFLPEAIASYENCKFLNLSRLYFRNAMMTVLRRSKILILNGSRSIDVNTKYQQEQTNNLNS